MSATHPAAGPMAPLPTSVDVVVIGGGPGGAAAATELARLGRKVLVLERDEFPRFHIGESLLPWNNDLFDELGVGDKIRNAGFVEKWGATFFTADGSLDSYADFSLAAETKCPRAWQVRRATLDRLLLDHAASSGASVEQGVRVADISFSDGVATVSHERGGVAGTTSARIVIDAGGKNSVLGRRHGQRDMDAALHNISVHAQYTGIPRPEGRRKGDIRIATRRDAGWVWLIPLDEETTSVGVVLPAAIHKKLAANTPAESLDRYLAEVPSLEDLLSGATRVTEARFDADYSYLARVHAGDGWMLVGDAGAFLDPVFSTGVYLAMQGGVDAARAADAALSRGDTSQRSFMGFERGVRRRYHHFRRFVVAFQEPAFRALFFRPGERRGTYEAVLSILAGNWRPGLLVRARIAWFFLLVALQRKLRFLDDSAFRELPVAAAPSPAAAAS